MVSMTECPSMAFKTTMKWFKTHIMIILISLRIQVISPTVMYSSIWICTMTLEEVNRIINNKTTTKVSRMKTQTCIIKAHHSKIINSTTIIRRAHSMMMASTQRIIMMDSLGRQRTTECRQQMSKLACT
jgi:hypothetical protein